MSIYSAGIRFLDFDSCDDLHLHIYICRLLSIGSPKKIDILVRNIASFRQLKYLFSGCLLGTISWICNGPHQVTFILIKFPIKSASSQKLIMI